MMNGNGIEPEQVNGHPSGEICTRHNGRNAGKGELDGAQKVEQSISYMLQHLNQPLQVATLAAAVNVSPSHYCALFKRWTGYPPIDYFIHLRMQHACRLFDSTSLNVKEVAAAMGYDDPFYFSRTFKAVHGVPPSEYRALPEKVKDTIKRAVSTASQPTSDFGRDQTIHSANGNGASRLEVYEMPTEGRASTVSESDFSKRVRSMEKNEMKSNRALLERA